MTSIAELLQTDDPAEQLVRLQRLIQANQLPTISLLVTVQQHNGQIAVSCSDPALPAEAKYEILDYARRELLRQERAALAPAPQPEEQPASQPPPRTPRGRTHASAAD